MAADWDAHLEETVESTLGIMAALGDVAVFGRRINIGMNGRVVIRTWSILEWRELDSILSLEHLAPGALQENQQKTTLAAKKT